MQEVLHTYIRQKFWILLLDQVVKLPQRCLVMPASNATSERAFSACNATYKDIRNSMSQNRLNHTMCINVHSEKVNSIDLKLSLNEFIVSKWQTDACFRSTVVYFIVFCSLFVYSLFHLSKCFGWIFLLLITDFDTYSRPDFLRFVTKE